MSSDHVPSDVSKEEEYLYYLQNKWRIEEHYQQWCEKHRLDPEDVGSAIEYDQAHR